MDKDEDDPEFSTSTAQQPRSHSDIVQELLAQLAKVEGYDETEFAVGHDKDSVVNEVWGKDQPDGDGGCDRLIVTDSGENTDSQQILPETRMSVVTVSTDSGLVCQAYKRIPECMPSHISVKVLHRKRSQDITTLHTRS